MSEREAIAIAILNYRVKHGVVQGLLSSNDTYLLADKILAALAAARPDMEGLIEQCAKIAEAHKWSAEIRAATNGARTYGNDEACEKIAAAIRALSHEQVMDK